MHIFQLFRRLNKVHLVLTDKQRMLQAFADSSTERITQAVSAGKDGKINGDNLDLRVATHDQRMDRHASDYHFFASDWTPFRYEGPPIHSTATVGNPEAIGIATFTPSFEEVAVYKQQLKVLLGRELMEYFPAFSWMKPVLPGHIHHEHAHIMAKKSTPYVMPLLLYNEAKYDDCIHIMESYVNQLRNWYTRAGRGI